MSARSIARLPVAIIGAGDAHEQSCAWTAAYQVGRALADAGVPVVCGGRGGVMEAACRGAHDGGGISIAILPRLDAVEANSYATIVLPTDLGDVRTPICRAPSDVSRNRVIAAAGRCAIAIGGGAGTANEIKHALAFGKTVFGLCGSPDPEALAGSDPRHACGEYVRLGSAHKAIRRVLELLAAS